VSNQIQSHLSDSTPSHLPHQWLKPVFFELCQTGNEVAVPIRFRLGQRDQGMLAGWQLG
jgi:hypothetical protein